MKYLRNYIREACPVLQTNGPRWKEHPSFWLFGKHELSAVLPHLNCKAKTGPARKDCNGVRWISADFADGNGAIVNDYLLGGSVARPKRSAHIFQKLKEVPWRGIMIYIKMDAKYVEDMDAELDVVEWPAKPAAAEPIVHVPPEPSVDA